MDNRTNYEQAILNAVIDRIDALRVKSGMSIYKLAQEALISESTLKKLLRRQTFPNILTIYRLCEVLQVSVSEFFDFDTDAVKIAEERLTLISAFEALSPNNKWLVLELIKNLK